MSSQSNSRSARHSDSDERFNAGDKVGRYRLLALLASGGMGHVWAARPEGSGFARTVALKLVRSEMSQDENYARMFIDEATVASSIHHPNVCETFELGRHGDTLFMAMEWVSGDSLAGLLRQGDSLVGLEPTIAARVIADACAGLHAAHESVGPDGSLLGVVHRDISPPNILVSLQGQAKVSDFGIAKARHQLHERTRTGEVKGKFAYIPPEQVAGDAVDRRADVYAMGCVLYVATLGVRPFGNGGEALGKILRNEYKPPSAVLPGYPPGLEAVIVKALAGEPNERFQTAEEMQVALEEWLLSCGKVVTANEVAKCVQSRLSTETRARNAALMTQNRVLPDQMLGRLAKDSDSETPTAGSGLVTAPASLWRGGQALEGERTDESAMEFSTDPHAQPKPDPAPSAGTIALNAPPLVPPEPRASDATQVLEFTVTAPKSIHLPIQPRPPLERASATTAADTARAEIAANSAPKPHRAWALLGLLVLVLVVLLALRASH